MQFVQIRQIFSKQICKNYFPHLKGFFWVFLFFCFCFFFVFVFLLMGWGWSCWSWNGLLIIKAKHVIWTQILSIDFSKDYCSQCWIKTFAMCNKKCGTLHFKFLLLPSIYVIHYTYTVPNWAANAENLKHFAQQYQLHPMLLLHKFIQTNNWLPMQQSNQ